MTTVSRFPANCEPDAVAEAMSRHGYAIVENLADDLVARAATLHGGGANHSR